MPLIKFHSKAVRLNGITDGLVVPTGRFRESGKDGSQASKIGAVHYEALSNPLNAIRGAFTIDAFIIPDYGGVVVEKPGQYKLTYGSPFDQDRMTFTAHISGKPVSITTAFNVRTERTAHSGSYSGGEHKPHSMTEGTQGLVMVTAQYTRKELKCFINGDLVAKLNIGDDAGLLDESSSDLFIGGQGGEFRGIIESVRISQGEINPVVQPLTRLESTFGLWSFNDEQSIPDVRFFNNARSAYTHQGRDGADTHDGLFDIPMVAIGHTFNTSGHFKIRDFSSNPGSVTDQYSALEKLASLATGIPLSEISGQSWYSTSLDLGDETYVGAVKSTPLNAVINHSGYHPMTGTSTGPSSREVTYASDSAGSATSTTDLDPMQNLIERVRITAIDFANSRVSCESILLSNDGSGNPQAQGMLFSHTNDTPVWFTVGKADIIIDPGSTTRAANVNTRAEFTFGQRFSDTTEYRNDAYFFSPKSRISGSTSSALLSSTDTYGYHGAVTSNTLVDGDFFLKMIPAAEKQTVKQTVQGISNTFETMDDDITIQSVISQNEVVRVSEPVFSGPISRVINKAQTVGAAMADSNAANRIVVESGIGFNDKSASTRDEIVAIAVSNPKPFMLKGLDTEHTGGIQGGVPTNDAYIRHLTPLDTPRIATIDSPSALVSAGGPSKVLVYYDAIDLTGEVVAGTGLTSSDVNTKFAADHATGNQAYLVVRKTVPHGSAIYNNKTVSDYLRRPTSTTTVSDVLLTITAPGGLISLPTATFNDKASSHTLRSNPTGDITPSSFINIEDTVLGLGTGIRGYGRPKAIPSINTPDDTSNSDYHILHVSGSTATDNTGHRDEFLRPSSMNRGNLMGFDVVDNELKGNESLVLVHPANTSRHSALADMENTYKQPNDLLTATVERSLMRGRIEEIEPITSGDGEPMLIIRGRSILMDIADARTDRDFDLGEGMPIKEIGDLGTPTVTMTMAGPGQGAIDVNPIYSTHPHFPGWKDRVIGSGNASVRNDSQTSTYYASTRALVEIPLFPSMFFDTEKRLSTTTDPGDPLPSDRSFDMTIDCTMTAINRAQMRETESAFAVDWGLKNTVSSIETTDKLEELHIEDDASHYTLCQRPSVQAVVTAVDSSDAYIDVDDWSAFVAATGERGDSTGLSTTFYITIGQGVGTYAKNGMIAKATLSGTTNRINIVGLWNPYVVPSPTGGTGITVNSSSQLPTRATLDVSSNISVGMTVVLGGYLIASKGGYGATNEPDIIFDPSSASVHSQIITAVRNCLGLPSDRVHVDPQNSNRVLIRDGPNMEGLVFDPFELYDSFNDRTNILPLQCKTAHLLLRGKKADASGLEFIRPQSIDFNDITNRINEFDGAFNEVIRRINMAGHPLAKNADGGSAFDPPAIFPATAGDTKTGTHMGHVRAYPGKDVESAEGERGRTLVIHSTVPGASGRNFCIRMRNRTPYPYKPASIVGVGGLLATNSRSYSPNSFPAPLPISEDGKTFAPISVLKGAPHGQVLQQGSTSDVRSYDGIGGILRVNTVGTPQMIDNSSPPAMVDPVFGSISTTINHIAVEKKALDHALRHSRNTVGGIIRIGGQLASFDEISPVKHGGNYINDQHLGSNCVFFRNVVPRGNPADFARTIHNTSDSPLDGIEIEIIDPLIDTEAIIFFAGGHTGTVFDISDGTANDYSGEYKHFLSKGPTGFSGFQNLHEVSTASAVLDFTDITDDDTINDNTMRGIHNKMEIRVNNIVPRSLLYVRMNDTISGSSFTRAQEITDDLYGSSLRLTASAAQSSSNGPANSVDSTSKALLFDSSTGYPVISTADYLSSAVVPEYGPLNGFDPTGDFSITCFIKGNIMHGPIISGYLNNKYFGLHVGYASTNTTNRQHLSFMGYGGTNQVVSFAANSTISSDSSPNDGNNYLLLPTNDWIFVGFTHGAHPSKNKLYIGPIDDFTSPVADLDDDSEADTTTSKTSQNPHPSIFAASAELATIPSAYGGGTTPTNGLVMIGASLLKDLIVDGSMSSDGVARSFNDTLTQKYNSGANKTLLTGEDSSGSTSVTSSSKPIHAANMQISELAIHNRVLTFAEMTEIGNAKTVW